MTCKYIYNMCMNVCMFQNDDDDDDDSVKNFAIGILKENYNRIYQL